jgi:hypothetical protein
MRDKNLSLETFSIQLEKTVNRVCQLGHRFPTCTVLDSPTRLLTSEEISISYPRNFRLIRTLSIIQWYLPEDLHWRIFLDLKEEKFSQFNFKQKVELDILLSSKENCEFFLYETKRYSSSEIFGNILGNDLRELNKTLKISRRRKRKPLKAVRRRGYKDHGTRRPSDRWLPTDDFSLTIEQNSLENFQDHYNSLIKRLLSLIENKRQKS